ncbi:hypothetical protein PIB30_084818 [Stylosanthes scabra]|uniref:Uncharacterized protein n=1 Tax=Stylosanthes scabra TaxID=79078 RepID=A0ABU6SSZ0_9FABA|nr:hypothetical protein [Stylosanthes scabra]
MGGQDSTFGVRRCAFGDKPYGVAESYSREGIDMERLVRNIDPTRELEAFWAKLASFEPSFDVFRVVLLASGYLTYGEESSGFIMSGCYVSPWDPIVEGRRFLFHC